MEYPGQLKQKITLFHAPNLIAAMSPIFILLGTLIFPLMDVEKLTIYASDAIPPMFLLFGFVPAAFIYAFGLKKRYAILAIALSIAVFIAFAVLGDRNTGMLALYLQENIALKFSTYQELIPNSNPFRHMTMFDESWGLGLYMLGLGLILLPVSLIAPKYKHQNDFHGVLKDLKPLFSKYLTLLKASASKVDMVKVKSTVDLFKEKATTININDLKSLNVNTIKAQLLSLSTKRKVGCIAAILLIAFMFSGTPTPNESDVEKHIISTVKESFGFEAIVKDLNIRGCEETSVRRVTCIIDSNIIIKDKSGKVVAKSVIVKHEAEYPYVEGEFEMIDMQHYLSEDAINVMALDMFSNGMKSLFKRR